MAIIETLAQNKSLKQSAKRITKGDDLWQDLFHDSLLKIYDLGEERVVGLSQEGNIAGYMAIVMHHNWHNPRSTFNKQYRPQQENQDRVGVDEQVKADRYAPDDYEEPIKLQKGDIDLCYEHFGKDCNLTPERIVVARAMDKMKREDNQKNTFHYRTALLQLYIQLGGIAQVSRETEIARQHVRKDLNEAINTIKKNGEDTTH